MSAYRVYCLDGAGKVWAAEWIEAENDFAALSAAREINGAIRYEIWEGQRLVGRIQVDPQIPNED